MSYLFKYMRHKSIVKRMNVQRLLNCMLLCAELKARKARISSYPIIARINICPFCNLKCPACQRIAQSTVEPATNMMTLSQYRAILDQIGKYLLLVVLYDEGEPLLNPRLPEIIRYTGSLNISTSISTNLAMPLSDEYMLELVDAGLDRITISMDGITQDIYGSYRIGGDLRLLQDNLERLLAFRKRARSNMHVEVQFLDFGFNTHQKEEVREYAYRIGADNFRALPSSTLGLEEYLAKAGRTLSEQDHLKRGCLDIYGIAHISSEGSLFPCDFGEDSGMSPAGNLLQKDFSQLWNSPGLTRTRAYFNNADTSFDSAICRRCPATNVAPRFLR